LRRLHQDQGVGYKIRDLDGHQGQREAAKPAQAGGFDLHGIVAEFAKDKAQKDDTTDG
jgi:hypothetical protein